MLHSYTQVLILDDNTVGYHLNLLLMSHGLLWSTVSSVTSKMTYGELCALLSKEITADMYDIIFAACERPHTPLYLCEFRLHSDQESKHKENIHLPQPRLPCQSELSTNTDRSESNCKRIPFPVTICKGNHFTHTFLTSVESKYCPPLANKFSRSTGLY